MINKKSKSRLKTTASKLLQFTVGRMAKILFQITADAQPGMPGVSKDQKLCEKLRVTHCHPAKIE